jgi:uncharacterized protein YkwD
MKIFSVALAAISLLFLVSFKHPVNNPLRDDVFKYTNEFRKSKKLAELIMNDELNELAEKHSKNMASGKVAFGHDGFSERTEKVRKKLNDALVAENVAYGPYNGKEVVEQWKKSSGHRANILGKYKYIGIGVAKSKNGMVYFTQIFAD